jgi:hypothetical protein
MSADQSSKYTVWARCVVPDAIDQNDAEHVVLQACEDMAAEVWLGSDVITEEMVERAAVAAFDRDTMDGHHKGGQWTWDGIPEMGRCNYRLTVRAALEAAIGGA